MFRTALAVLAVLLSKAAHAQVYNCAKNSYHMSTAENGVCSHREFTKADRALDVVYKAALAKIRRNIDGRLDEPFDPKSWEAELNCSQQAWLSFREIDCNDLVGIEWLGGTGTGIGVFKCMTKLTNARAQSLRERYELR